MNKATLIGGIASAMVIASVGSYLTWGNLPDQSTLENSLLQEYRELLREMNDANTKDDLESKCEDAQDFSNQIQALKTKLDLLKKRKNDLLNEMVYVPPLPEFSGEPDGPPLPELSDSNYIPPLPEFSGEPEDAPPLPELSDSDYIPPLPEFSGEQEDTLTELPPMPDGEEWIPELPPLPGEEEWIPELPPLPDEEEWIPELPPLPGEEEWIPELPPLPDEEGFIPPLPEIDEKDSKVTTVLEEINALEEKITLALNALQSMCDEEATDILSTSCVDACNKYSDCAGYTEGATKTDQQDAYDSCMEECTKWSDKTKICINKQPIKTVTDCTNLSICALAEYSNMFGE